MPVPKSVTKVSKDGSVTYISQVDAVTYTISELTRGALRDVAKFLMKSFKNEYYSVFNKRTGNAGKNVGYWVRKNQSDLQIGLDYNKTKGKHANSAGFYVRYQETGTRKQPKKGILRYTVENNVDKIREIESQYLNRLNDDKPDLSDVQEDDMEGNGFEE